MNVSIVKCVLRVTVFLCNYNIPAYMFSVRFKIVVTDAKMTFIIQGSCTDAVRRFIDIRFRFHSLSRQSVAIKRFQIDPNDFLSAGRDYCV